MKSFEYAIPSSLEEASSLLAQSWGETEILAGGTDLVTSLKQQVTAPKRVVSLRNISSLKGITVQRQSVRIGAMTTLADLTANSAVKEHFPALVKAVQGIGSQQIISAGTVGGDLCQRPRCWYYRNGFGLFGKQGDTSLVLEGDNRYHAIFGNEGPAYFVSASSLGPALIALGATLKISGTKGKTREVAAREFFRTPKSESERETVLRPNEILFEITIPIRGLKNATYEVRHRQGLDWPYVTATVSFALKGGTASNASVVLGHVAPVPWPSAAASKALNGARIDASLAAKCGQAATEGAKPLSGNAYKLQLVKTAVKRAVLDAAAAA
ncbi:MAG: FAD binding domain-containing protein [Verrucomicrobia bacterium]|nr:FAD binding domain-containing protein [Verrucomicrobiota bacterium]